MMYQVFKLSDYFKIKSSKRVHKSDWTKEGVPFYRAREIVKLSNNGQVKNDLFISNELFERFKSITGVPKYQDIVISAVGTLGKCYMVKSDDKFYFKDASVLWFEKISQIDSKYVIYLFKSNEIMKQILSNSMGATVGTLTISRANEIKIPVPPLSEQKQIVETLDKAFEKIDKAIANVERNIENAEELFQSQIESRFNSDLSWERINLGDLSKIMYGHTSKVDPNGNCKYLRITDIQDSKVNWDQVPSIKIDEKDFFKYNLNKGDIVFARTGATTGKSYLIKDNPNAVFASYLIRVQINNNNILPEFVYKFFSSREYWRVVKSGISGSAQGGFNASKLSELKIKFPKDIIVQKKVVQEIDIIEKNINALLSKYHTKLLSLSNLKKSILEKAFKGELTNAA
ncbi:restriction endonuclease subunit S [Flavobacteriaceae bacterium]|nr:restriction endonuclease subunit S [Flavobacteriaceae bacterium]